MTRKKSTTSSFFDKYKHPKWQKRRLEIMEASGFQCSSCGSEDKTLNVHHVFYVAGRDPWEYENNELECLCAECHEEKHADESYLKSVLNRFKSHTGYAYCPLFLAGFLEGLMSDEPTTIKPKSFEWLEGFATAVQRVDTSRISSVIPVIDQLDEIHADELEILLKERLIGYEIDQQKEYSWVRNRMKRHPILQQAAEELLKRSGIGGTE